MPISRGGGAGACCCGSRTSTARAASRNTSRRSTTISPGSASTGSSRCGGNRSISSLSRGACEAAGAGSRLCKLRKPRRYRAHGAEREGEGPGRAIRTVRRSILATRDALSPSRAHDTLATQPYALAARHGRPRAAAGALTWTETGDRAARRKRQVAAAPQAWGDVVLARKDMPTSYHLRWSWTTRCKASRMSCAGRTCSGRPRAPAVAAFARPARAGLSPSPADLDSDGRKLSKSTRRRRCAIAGGRRDARRHPADGGPE